MITIDISPEFYVYIFLFILFSGIFFHYGNYGSECFFGILLIFNFFVFICKKIYNNYKKKDNII